MTLMQDHLTGRPDTGLPDPDTLPEFYADTVAKRFFAWLVDVLIIALITAITVPFTLFLGLFFLPLIFASVSFLYRVMTLASGSATWGMRLMSIELRERDGGTLGAGTAFLHVVGYFVSVAVFPLQLLSIVLMLMSPRRQGLTDHILGTAAVNRAARY